MYGSKSPATQQFKILGHVALRSLITENAEHNTFIIYGGQKAITVSAGTTAEKTLWLAELSKASAEIKSKPHVQLNLGTLKSCSEFHNKINILIRFDNFLSSFLKQKRIHSFSVIGSSEEGLDTCAQSTTGSTASAVRSNNAIHVCWHRGATVGLRDFIISSENQLSGYLLRKFKNSSGWQKLWVVFTSFCLFFYKNYQDEFALASLPLLGYVTFIINLQMSTEF